ncbi:MAG: FAD:protein FMN transferase [Lacipirellulaceae bacterium]
MPRRALTLVVLPLALALLGKTAGAADPRVETFVGRTMGTTYQVSYVATDGLPDAAELKPAVDALLVEVSRQMSTYDAASEVSRFNRQRGDGWFPVSKELGGVVDAALGVARDSGGAFDPTVAPLLAAWGFGPGPKAARPPSAERVARARQAVGYTLVEARLDPPALRKTNPRVALELSAIAPGYAVDAVADLLAAKGVAASMVEIGGEVVGRGRKPGGEPWRIGVEPADPEATAFQAVVELVDRAASTSGDYRNYFEHDGKRYSHTLDPRTGAPVDHSLATATVLAGTCQAADATATVLSVLGPEAGYAWAVEREVAALFVVRSDARDPPTFTEKRTPAWPAGAAP